MKRVSRTLLRTADSLIFLAKKIRGAAHGTSEKAALSLADCERHNWENVRPCFVLSTGRSGTLMLTNLLLTAPDAFPVHQPRPELVRASKLAYENILRVPETYREVFKSAREEYLLEAAQREQVFIETNNRITFFAPIIRDVFPNAVFIHLVRHPGDFVRSGIRRKWYSGDHDHDIGRIVPLTGPYAQRWPDYTLVEKIAWLWNETNNFIESAKQNIPSKEVLLVKSDELFADPKTIEKIFNFLRLDHLDLKSVQTVLTRPANVQKKGQFPKYEDWSERDKQNCTRMAPLAKEYGFEI